MDPCPHCLGQLRFTCEGNARPEPFILGDASYVFLAARLIVFSRERLWAPDELLRQPAAWVQAYQFLLPYVCRMVEEVRERERARAEMKNGGYQAHPGSSPDLP